MLTNRLGLRILPCGRMHVGVCRISTEKKFLQWEDLPPIEAPLEELEPLEVPKKRRFYIKPPLTDIQLENLTSVSEWPKSRVIWALGRFGFVPSLRNCSKSAIVIHRLEEQLEQLSTRDLTRAIQAMSYITSPDMGLVGKIRKKFSLEVNLVNDLFFISFMYGNLKLVNRSNIITENCHRSIQFLLSELVHRKSKIHSSHFL